MIRRLNYTGRKLIPHDNLLINVRKIDGKKAFNADLTLDGLGFPNNAKVFIEPYYKSSYMRFDFGTIEDFTAPIITYLSEIPETDQLLFRVKVVDIDGKNGKLLGLAERISPKSTDVESIGRQPLLPVDFEKDLGQQIYQIVFDEVGDQVILEINNRIENGPEFIRSNEFKSMVLPGIVRLIAERVKDHEFDSDSNGWEDLWLKFFYSKVNIEEKPEYNAYNKEAVDDWIENLVNTFCRKFDVYQNFLKIKFN
jgi:hypothetical protein